MCEGLAEHASPASLPVQFSCKAESVFGLYLTPALSSGDRMLFRRNGMGNLNSVASGRTPSHKRRSKALKWACEPLEPRWLLTTDIWTTIGGGDWSTGSNWSDNAPPAPGEDVLIDVAGQ